jgi:hypothetical protein
MLFSFAAGGFLRLHAHRLEPSGDVARHLLDNKDLLLSELKKYQGKVARSKSCSSRRRRRLEKLFAEARQARDQWLKSSS